MDLLEASAHGPPGLRPELEALNLQPAQENPNGGYGPFEGELSKLGDDVGRSTIQNVLKRQHVPPAPERSKRSGNWQMFLAHCKGQIVACDFFTVESA